MKKSSYIPRIGYASMNLDIRPSNYRTCRKDRINEDLLKILIAHNLEVLEKTLMYNIEQGNTMFRISSSLIPFGSSSLNTLKWETEFKVVFARLRGLIDTHDIRISMHPGQYTVLNAPNPEVVANAILDLKYHEKVLRLLTKSKDATMVLHVGGVYGDKKSALERFVQQYLRLDESIKDYLVIENDDRLFTVEDCLWISKEVNIPVVFDNLHHDINPSLCDIPIHILMDEVVKTWGDKKPKFHYSQQDPLKRKGAHSQTINLDQFIADYESFYQGIDVDLMLEVKDKNRSFVKVNQFFNPSQRVLEQEWARYKYCVMSKSQQTYNEVRLLFKNNNKVAVQKFYQKIDSRGVEDIKAQLNALQHIWGYFKKVASNQEKALYLDCFEKKDTIRMYHLLKRLSKKYAVEYLIESYYF